MITLLQLVLEESVLTVVSQVVLEESEVSEPFTIVQEIDVEEEDEDDSQAGEVGVEDVARPSDDVLNDDSEQLQVDITQNEVLQF